MVSCHTNLFKLGVVVGTQERVSAAFVLDCHEMIKCFLIIPALYTWPEIESRISLEYLEIGNRNAFKLTAKKRV